MNDPKTTNLIANINHIETLGVAYDLLRAKAAKRKLSVQDEIDKIHYERQFTSYRLDDVKIENVKYIPNISNMEIVIGAKSAYFADKRKNKTTGVVGSYVSPAIQVIDAYQNMLGTSYRDDMKTKRALESVVEPGPFKYNKAIFARYNIELPQ